MGGYRKNNKSSGNVSELSIWILGFGIKTTLGCLSVFCFFDFVHGSVYLGFENS